jgi:hypothetical protein
VVNDIATRDRFVKPVGAEVFPVARVYRKDVEFTFGILKGCWWILKSGI